MSRRKAKPEMPTVQIDDPEGIIKEASASLDEYLKRNLKQCHYCKPSIYLRWELIDLLCEYFGEEERELFKALLWFSTRPKARFAVGKALVAVLMQRLEEE